LNLYHVVVITLVTVKNGALTPAAMLRTLQRLDQAQVQGLTEKLSMNETAKLI